MFFETTLNNKRLGSGNVKDFEEVYGEEFKPRERLERIKLIRRVQSQRETQHSNFLVDQAPKPDSDELISDAKITTKTVKPVRIHFCWKLTNRMMNWRNA